MPLRTRCYSWVDQPQCRNFAFGKREAFSHPASCTTNVGTSRKKTPHAVFLGEKKLHDLDFVQEEDYGKN